MRRVWLAVLDDITSGITNLHSFEVRLTPERWAYWSVRDAMLAAYSEDDYIHGHQAHAYQLMPTKVIKTDEGKAASQENRLNCDGDPIYREGEIIEDPMGRTFMIFFIDPEARRLHVETWSLLEALSNAPNAEEQFLPLSETLLVLDALAGLPHLMTDSAD